jgi:hypothetical protein
MSAEPQYCDDCRNPFTSLVACCCIPGGVFLCRDCYEEHLAEHDKEDGAHER